MEDLPSLIKLAYLFNGNFFLDHRIKQLANWIQNLQSKSISIIHNSTKASISLNDAWLSGFTDAEGCFNVTFVKRAAYIVGFRTVIRFILDQNNSSVLKFILSLFNTGYIYHRKSSIGAYRYIVDSFKGLPTIVSYFDKFPLKTVKKEAFIKWSNIRSMMANKEHLTHEGFAKIKVLAKSVNNKSNIND